MGLFSALMGKKETLIYEGKARSLKVRFFTAEAPEKYLFFGDVRTCKKIIEFMEKNEYYYKTLEPLHNIDIIARAPAGQKTVKAVSQQYGDVDISEANAGKNRINLYEDILWISRIGKYNGKVPASELTDTAVRSFCNKMVEVIAHEATHLWHIRINLADDMRRRHGRRFESVSKAQSESLFHGQVKPAKLWVEYRLMLTALVERMILEGAATLSGLLARERLDFSQQTERKLLIDAAAKILTVQMLLDIEYKNVELALQQKISYAEADKKSIDTLRKIHAASYDIGLHIYHFLICSGHDLQKIFAMTPKQLVVQYEQECRKAGIQPVLSWGAGGLWSYDSEIRKIHSLRKKYS